MITGDPAAAPFIMSQRITIDSDQMGGVPCIRGLRIPVSVVVAMIGDGMPEAEILEAYPDLTRGDIVAAIIWEREMIRRRRAPSPGSILPDSEPGRSHLTS